MTLCRDALDAELYALLHRGTPGDVAFYARHCTGAPQVLELGAGYGRVAIELARRGASVVGLELDRFLLGLARRQARAAKVGADRLELVAGDMAAFDLGRRFDRIVIPHSGLYCLTAADQVDSCLRCVRRHLSADGLLVLDAYAADGFHAESEPDDTDAEQLDPLVTVQLPDHTWDVFEKSSWDKPAQRLDVTYLYRARSGEGTRSHCIEQRYLLVRELQDRLETAGLALRSLCGDFAGAPLGASSQTVVAVAGPAQPRGPVPPEWPAKPPKA